MLIRQSQIKSTFMLCLLVLMGMLYGCGFHLRGTVALPSALKRLHLVSQVGFSPFLTTLRRHLTDRGVILVDAHAKAYVLTIIEVRDAKQLSQQLGGAGAGKYNYTRTVRFSLSDAKGKVLITSAVVTASQTYTTSVTQQLIATQQLATLSTEINHALAKKILLRLTDAAL